MRTDGKNRFFIDFSDKAHKKFKNHCITPLVMVLTEKELQMLFEGGDIDEVTSITSDTYQTPLSLPDRGILIIEGDRYEKIQVYIGHAHKEKIIITAGWHERGHFCESGKPETESMQAIGKGIRQILLK